MTRGVSDTITVMTAKVAAGAGNKILVEDFRHITASIDLADSPNMTIKCVGSIANDAPDFEAAQSASNPYDFLQLIDLQDGNSIDGDTGITVAGSADNRTVNVNTDGLKWISFRITTRSAGNATVKVKGFDR